MILPPDLTPFPVTSRGDDAAADSRDQLEDFVRAGDVRRVLLGGAAEMPVEGLPADDFDSFAGRSDIPFPASDRAAGKPAAGMVMPGLSLDPPVIHPAFGRLSPVRRAAPPRPRGALDGEANFGRTRLTDRWWVMGMGLAAAAILFSGAAVDFISREAVRRSRSEVAPVPRLVQWSPAEAKPVQDEAAESFAAASGAAKER